MSSVICPLVSAGWPGRLQSAQSARSKIGHVAANARTRFALLHRDCGENLRALAADPVHHRFVVMSALSTRSVQDELMSRPGVSGGDEECELARPQSLDQGVSQREFCDKKTPARMRIGVRSLMELGSECQFSDSASEMDSCSGILRCFTKAGKGKRYLYRTHSSWMRR